MPDNRSSVTIIDNRSGTAHEIPVFENIIEAQSFKQAGLLLYDPGLRNTAVVESNVASLDGKAGTLHFRNHDITELLKKNLQYEDTLFLLINGKLPCRAEKSRLRDRLNGALSTPSTLMRNVIQSFPHDSPPMASILAGLTAQLAADPASLPAHVGKHIYTPSPELEDVLDAAIPRSLAALVHSIAFTLTRKSGNQSLPPLPNLSFVANTFRVLGRPLSNREEEAVERMWLIYADHGLANATAAFYHVSSTGADPVSSLIAALSSGYGPLHGGAMDMVFAMLDRVKEKSLVPTLIEEVKQKKTKLWGFGHRIYQTEDPRAGLVKAILADFPMTPMMEVAAEIERVASADPFFQSRHIHMNADLWGCFLYTALGLPYDIIFPLTAIARTAGYMARWREFILSNPPIWRPQQVYRGKLVKRRDGTVKL